MSNPNEVAKVALGNCHTLLTKPLHRGTLWFNHFRLWYDAGFEVLGARVFSTCSVRYRELAPQKLPIAGYAKLGGPQGTQPARGTAPIVLPDTLHYWSVSGAGIGHGHRQKARIRGCRLKRYHRAFQIGFARGPVCNFVADCRIASPSCLRLQTAWVTVCGSRRLRVSCVDSISVLRYSWLCFASVPLCCVHSVCVVSSAAAPAPWFHFLHSPRL